MGWHSRSWLQFVALMAGGACLLLGNLAAADEEAARKWLDRMSRAVEDLDYRGTFVYFRDGRVDTLRIIHRADESGVRERIYSLDGQPREILRDADRVKCYFPDNQALLVESQLVSRVIPALSLGGSVHPSEGYEFRDSGTERIAGHSARVVEIRPRDDYRYGQKFWLEEKTGMLLRSALLDGQGQLLQQLTFTDIELGAEIDDSELESRLEGDAVETRVTHLPDTRKPVDRRPTWQARELPQGFSLSSVEQSYHEDDPDFEHLVYSDGLASVSVYVERWDGDGNTDEMLESVGPVHVFSRTQDGLQITVVGEVPAGTVEFISRHMEAASGADSEKPSPAEHADSR